MARLLLNNGPNLDLPNAPESAGLGGKHDLYRTVPRRKVIAREDRHHQVFFGDMSRVRVDDLWACGRDIVLQAESRILSEEK